MNLLILPLLALSLFGHPPVMPPPTPTLPIEKKMLSLDATYYPLGSAIHVQASFPQDGGKVKGTVSGACTGEIDGQYTGDTKGKKLLGTVHANCPVLFFKVKVHAVFNGNLNSDDTWANVNYDAILDNHRTSGTYSFPLTLK